MDNSKHSNKYGRLWRRILEFGLRDDTDNASPKSENDFKSYIDLSPVENSSGNPICNTTGCSSDLRRCHSYDNLTCNNSKPPHSVIMEEQIPVKISETFSKVTEEEIKKEKNNETEAVGNAGDAEVVRQTTGLLCGYLNKMKLGSRGIGQTFKRRWFVMADESCSLLYFSTPRDKLELGKIEISKAVFTFQLESKSNMSNVFEVRTPDKAVLLQADDNQTMMYWIQNLQKKRKKYFLMQELSFNTAETPMITSLELDKTILSKVERPQKTVGESTAASRGLGMLRSRSFRDISLTKLRVEFQNKINNFKNTQNVSCTANNSFAEEEAKSLPAKNIHSSKHALASLGTAKFYSEDSNAGSPTDLDPDLSSLDPGHPHNKNTKLFGTFRDRLGKAGERNFTGRKLRTLFKGGSSDSCSECSKIQELLEDSKKNEAILTDELMAAQVSYKNLLKIVEKLTRELTQWKTNSSSTTDGHKSCMKEILEKDGEIVEMNELLLSLETELVKREDLLRASSQEIESLRLNLKIKDDMINFLTSEVPAIDSRKISDSHEITAARSNSASDADDRRNEWISKGSICSEDVCNKMSHMPLCKEEVILSVCDIAPLSQSTLAVTEVGNNQGTDKGDDGIIEVRESKSDSSVVCASGSNSDKHSDNVRRSLRSCKDRDGSPGYSSSDQNKNESIFMENKMELNDRFQDERIAYKSQNLMLNQEILNLNELLRLSEQRLDQSQIRITHLEALGYQLQSKHLKCLNEIYVTCSDSQDSIAAMEKLKQMIESAVQVDSSEGSSQQNVYYDQMPVSHLVFDRYGFEKVPSHGQGNVKALANDLEMKSNMIKTRKSQSDLTYTLKWETMLISLERGTSSKTSDLKLMIREGIPGQFRTKLWKICIDFHLHEYRINSVVKSYQSILDMILNKTVVTPSANQIELDLLRTLPNNKHFSTLNSQKVTSLRNILLAFSIHNPDIGYCQGLNRLAAILLLFLNEEESFWGLVAIVEVIMPPKYYNHTLIAAHADQRVLKDIITEKLPVLTNHFTTLSFDLSLFTFSWFLTIFVDNMPVAAFLRIWDTFLYEGNKVLFRYAVAIMKYFEEKLLMHKTAAEMNMFVRGMCEELHDVDRLSQIAFNELNPFSMRKVRMKRQVHLQRLTSELEELDKLRRSFVQSFSTRQREPSLNSINKNTNAPRKSHSSSVLSSDED